MSLLDLSARALLDRFASSDPTPGGGSAAALAGATGAALVAMVCGMPKTRTGSLDERSRLAEALAAVGGAGDRLRQLVDDDTAAYDAVVAAYRLPKDTDDQKAARKQAVAEAMRKATEVPLRTAEACLLVLRAAGGALADGNPNAASDARTGGALAWAGLLGATANVQVNTAGRSENASLEGQATALLLEGRKHAEALGLMESAPSE
jgi:formiminotetrahydrofolate cyclodeaminase